MGTPPLVEPHRGRATCLRLVEEGTRCGTPVEVVAVARPRGGEAVTRCRRSSLAARAATHPPWSSRNQSPRPCPASSAASPRNSGTSSPNLPTKPPFASESSSACAEEPGCRFSVVGEKISRGKRALDTNLSRTRVTGMEFSGETEEEERGSG